MKTSIVVLVVVGLLAQGASVDGGILDSLANLTTSLVTGVFNSLNSMVSAIAKPLTNAVALVNNVSTSFSNLITTGLVATANTISLTLQEAVNAAVAMLDDIVQTANNIATIDNISLNKATQMVLDSLARGLDAVTESLRKLGEQVNKSINEISKAITNEQTNMNQNTDSCISKLNLYGYTSASSRLQTYKSNVTYILGNLTEDVTSMVSDFGQFLNDYSSYETFMVAQLTQTLLDQLDNIANNTAKPLRKEFETCFNNTSAAIKSEQTTLLNKVLTCILAANGSVSGLQISTVTVDSTAQKAIATVCKCVENLNLFSSTAQRQQAKTCAEDASAKLDIYPIEDQVHILWNDFDDKISVARANFYTCLREVKDYQNNASLTLAGMANSCSEYEERVLGD